VQQKGMEEINTLKIDLLGDSSATDLILRKLLETSGDDNQEEEEFEYSKITKYLAGLRVAVRLLKDTRDEDPPHALFIALSTHDAVSIEEYLNKHPATPTAVLVLNQSNVETKKIIQALKIKMDHCAGRNQFIHFVETNEENLKYTFDSLINMAVVLSSDSSLMATLPKVGRLNQRDYA
jgi:hypothetical protein